MLSGRTDFVEIVASARRKAQLKMCCWSFDDHQVSVHDTTGCLCVRASAELDNSQLWRPSVRISSSLPSSAESTRSPLSQVRQKEQRTSRIDQHLNVVQVTVSVPKYPSQSSRSSRPTMCLSSGSRSMSLVWRTATSTPRSSSESQLLRSSATSSVSRVRLPISPYPPIVTYLSKET